MCLIVTCMHHCIIRNICEMRLDTLSWKSLTADFSFVIPDLYSAIFKSCTSLLQSVLVMLAGLAAFYYLIRIYYRERVADCKWLAGRFFFFSAAKLWAQCNSDQDLDILWSHWNEAKELRQSYFVKYITYGVPSSQSRNCMLSAL